MFKLSFLALAGLLVLAAGAAPLAETAAGSGQEAADGTVKTLTARDEARWAVAADRDSFIEGLIAQWEAEYGVTNAEELRQLLHETADWRLVEASLAETSRQITAALLGHPRMVRALGNGSADMSLDPDAPMLAESGNVSPDAIGFLLADMVFNRMTPCRNFDTRISQGGTGPFAAAETRGYLAQAGEAGSNEGEKVGGCRVPDDAWAVAINLTVVGPAANGFLTAWSNGTRPTAASMVYEGSTELLSNSTIVPICFPFLITCNDDYLVYSNAASDVVGDFVGYFSVVEPCEFPLNKTYDAATNRCWDTADRGPSNFFQASDACNSDLGRLPSFGEANSFTGSLSNSRRYWLDGWYHDGTDFRGDTIEGNGSLERVTTIVDQYYRCTYDPYTF